MNRDGSVSSSVKTKSQGLLRPKSASRSESLEETTPLLAQDESQPADDEQTNGEPQFPRRPSTQSFSSQDGTKPSRRWPVGVALVVLSTLFIFVLTLGFLAPAAIEEYSVQALVFEPKHASIDSFTDSGVKARVQGSFNLDSSRVQRAVVRVTGRWLTWIARKAESKPATVALTLPEYGGRELGTVRMPGITVDLRSGHVTSLDFVAEIVPGDISAIRRLLSDFLEKRLSQLRLKGTAEVRLRSGVLPLGVQKVSHALLLKGQNLPALPKYNISGLHVHEIKIPERQRPTAIAAEAKISAFNPYPVAFDIPNLNFEVLVANCLPSDPNILIGNLSVPLTRITPKQNVEASAEAIIRKIPKELLANCPNSDYSPLDVLLDEYLRGVKTTIYIRGSPTQSQETPEWISDLLPSLLVPVPITGHSFDNLIKNFSLTDVHFSMPNPMAEPGDPQAQPRLSSTVEAFVNLPSEISLPLNVSRVRSDADVFYKGQKLGKLDLHKWQRANSSQVKETNQTFLKIEAKVKEAPLNVTNDSVLSEVIRNMLFDGKAVILSIKANVDVDVETTLGAFVARKIPAEGSVTINPPSGDGLSSVLPSITELEIAHTTEKTVLLRASLNMTNPTPYSAVVPYFNINIVNNNTVLAQAIAKDVFLSPGINERIPISAIWNPVGFSGERGRRIGRELISQFISGFNTTLTLQTHQDSIPHNPALGKALASLHIQIPTPKLPKPRLPGDGDGDGDGGNDEETHFIRDATMHLFTSTATFTLVSPLRNSTLYLTNINATAFYNHTHQVGRILFDEPFEVPPGQKETPRLPVDWSLKGVGYEAARRALGGTLKLDAFAFVGVRIGEWEDEIWYSGTGIGAKVRL